MNPGKVILVAWALARNGEDNVERELKCAQGPCQVLSDVSCMRTGLHWRPRHAGLLEIVETAWRWHQRHGQ